MNEYDFIELLSKYLYESLCETYGNTHTRWDDLSCAQQDSYTRQCVKREIIPLMKEAGFVQLAEDQSPPDNPFHHLAGGHYDGWRQGREDMLKAGWRKVEL